jgi:hypothetical protein
MAQETAWATAEDLTVGWPKKQQQLKGFDKKVIALYARGFSTRDI